MYLTDTIFQLYKELIRLYKLYSNCYLNEQGRSLKFNEAANNSDIWNIGMGSFCFFVKRPQAKKVY